jgi:hypothetical protein
VNLNTKQSEIQIFLGGAKLTRTTVDRGLRCHEKCLLVSQIIGSIILYIVIPIVYYAGLRFDLSLATYIVGGFFAYYTLVFV